MAEDSTNTDNEGAIAEITVTAAKKPSPSVSQVAAEAANTAVGIALAPATTIRGKAQRAFTRAAGDGGEPNEAARRLGDRANDRQNSGNDPDALSGVVGKVNNAPIGAVVGGNIAGTIEVANGALNSRETVGGTISKAGIDVATTIADRTGPIIGGAVGGLMGALGSGKNINELKRGIEILDKKGVPGFEHQTRVINGKTVDVFVSAVGSDGKPVEKPWVHIKGSKSDPAVREFAEEVKNQAIGELDEHNVSVAEDNEARSKNREIASENYNKKSEELQKKYGLDSEEEVTLSDEDLNAYNEEEKKLSDELEKINEANKKRSADGEIVTEMKDAYDEIDIAKRGPSASTPASHLAQQNPSANSNLSFTAP